jgi:hypothetical protein
MRLRIAIAITLGLGIQASVVSAQDQSHWGIQATVAPGWSTPTSIGTALGGTIDMRGSDFTVGFVHGRELGGDWGVSFVRKAVTDGSRADDVSQNCFSTACFLDGESRVYTNTAMTGIEIHKYVNFVTIQRRVQIGMNFAGGIASVSGTQIRTVYSADVVGSDRFGNPIAIQQQAISVEPADFGVSPFPLAKIQLAVGVLATHGVKIRAAGGLNVPGVEAFSVTGVYLFGAR